MKKTMISVLAMVMAAVLIGNFAGFAASSDGAVSSERSKQIREAETQFMKKYSGVERISASEISPDGTYYALFGSENTNGNSEKLAYLVVVKPGESKFTSHDISGMINVPGKRYYDIRDMYATSDDRLAVTFQAFDDYSVISFPQRDKDGKPITDKKGREKKTEDYLAVDPVNYALILNTDTMKSVKVVYGGKPDHLGKDTWEVNENTISFVEKVYPEDYTTSTKPFHVKRVNHQYSLATGQSTSSSK